MLYEKKTVIPALESLGANVRQSLVGLPWQVLVEVSTLKAESSWMVHEPELAMSVAPPMAVESGPQVGAGATEDEEEEDAAEEEADEEEDGATEEEEDEGDGDEDKDETEMTDETDETEETDDDAIEIDDEDDEADDAEDTDDEADDAEEDTGLGLHLDAAARPEPARIVVRTVVIFIVMVDVQISRCGVTRNGGEDRGRGC